MALPLYDYRNQSEVRVLKTLSEKTGHGWEVRQTPGSSHLNFKADDGLVVEVALSPLGSTDPIKMYEELVDAVIDGYRSAGGNTAGWTKAIFIGGPLNGKKFTYRDPEQVADLVAQKWWGSYAPHKDLTHPTSREVWVPAIDQPKVEDAQPKCLECGKPTRPGYIHFCKRP